MSPSLNRCELTFLRRQPIDVQRAQTQHEAFAGTLRNMGVHVGLLPELPDHPDATFVEDTAVLLPEVSVITRPGAASRWAEVESVAARLASHAPIRWISEGAFLDGGDVLRIGKTLYVGESRRTNPAGLMSLKGIVEAYGYEVKGVKLCDCLHLKTAATFIPPHFLAVNPDWVNPDQFESVRPFCVDASEPFAGNTLTLFGTTLLSASNRKTEEKLRRAGIVTRCVEISELEKAEAGLTCLVLLVEGPAR